MGTDSTDREGYPALLLDMDGVVLVGPETAPAVYREAAERALAECGVANPSAGALETLGASRYDESMASACDSLGVDLEAFWAARERHASELTNERVRTGERETYDDLDAIRELLGTVPVGIASNNRQATVTFVADYCFDGALATAVGREPTLEGYRRRKPEPDLLLAAVADLAVDPLYVGDKPKDLLAAERAGLDAAFLRRPHNESVDLDHDPAVVLEDLWALRELVGT